MGPVQLDDAESSGPEKLQKPDDGMVDNVTPNDHYPDVDFVNLVHTEHGMTQDQIDGGRRSELAKLVEFEAYRPIDDDEKTDLLLPTWLDRIKPDSTAKSSLVVQDRSTY